MAFSFTGLIYKKMLISHSHTWDVYFHMTSKSSRAPAERGPKVSVINRGSPKVVKTLHNVLLFNSFFLFFKKQEKAQEELGTRQSHLHNHT